MSIETDPARRLRRTPTGEIDRAIIAEAVRRHAGASPARLMAKHTHPPRFVYEARFDDRPTVYFKGEHDTQGDDAIVLECWAMDAAHGAGAPVPRVIALDTTEAIFPGRFAIFGAAAGVPLAAFGRDEPLRERVLEQAGRAIRRVHQIRVPGFGPLDDTRYLREGVVRGAYDSWRQYALDRAVDAIGVLLATGVIDERSSDVYRRTLEDADPVFDVTDTRLLHGDFDETHVFGDPATGELTSIIDWGDREASDPAWELGSLLLWDGPRALERVLRGYAPDPAERAEILERAQVYALADGLRLAAKRCAQRRIDDARSTLAEIGRARGHGGG